MGETQQSNCHAELVSASYHPAQPSPSREGKRNAFTLAEVLITLVIIGVIAAITVPSLIAKYHEEQLKTQFKKVYSVLSQAINKTNMKNYSGNVKCYYDINNDSYNKDCNNFFHELKKELIINKVCENNALTNGCLHSYPLDSTVSKGCYQYNPQVFDTKSSVFILQDSTTIIFSNDIYKYNANASIFVDINGLKGPNKYGYDLFGFIFYYKPKSGIYLTDLGCKTSPGAYTTKEMMKYIYQ